MNKKTVYLGLGSNLGDRMEHLRTALSRLSAADGLVLTGLSPVYQTEPVGYVAQEDFYNMVAEATTSLSPAELLATVKEIEESMGRLEAVHKGPREIDIDILLFDELRVDEYKLSIPHPRMLEREFVLRPLYDIDPDLRIEPLGMAVRDALADIAGAKRVVRLPDEIRLSEVARDGV